MKITSKIPEYLIGGKFANQIIDTWNKVASELECEYGIQIGVDEEYDANNYISYIYFVIDTKRFECAAALKKALNMKELL